MKRGILLALIICLAVVFGSPLLASAQPGISNNNSAAQGQLQGQAQSATVNPTITNTNTAAQGQSQGQSQGVVFKPTITNTTSAQQGQGQGQSISGTNIGSPEAGVSISSTSTDINPRQFPIPGNAPFAYLPSYFGPATADVNWQTMKTMAKYKLDWTASDAEALLTGTSSGWCRPAKLKSKPKCFSGTMSQTPAAGAIRVAVNGDSKLVERDYTMIGTNDVWSNNVETTTREVLGQAIMDGLKMGADVLLVTGEGAAVVMKAFGWGVGINNSVSVVTGNLGNVGNVTAAGIGVSGVEAGYRSKPWLQVLYFKRMLAALPAIPPAAIAPAPPAKPAAPAAEAPAKPAAPAAAAPTPAPAEETPGFKAWRKTTMP